MKNKKKKNKKKEPVIKKMKARKIKHTPESIEREKRKEKKEEKKEWAEQKEQDKREREKKLEKWVKKWDEGKEKFKKTKEGIFLKGLIIILQKNGLGLSGELEYGDKPDPELLKYIGGSSIMVYERSDDIDVPYAPSWEKVFYFPNKEIAIQEKHYSRDESVTLSVCELFESSSKSKETITYKGKELKLSDIGFSETSSEYDY